MQEIKPLILLLLACIISVVLIPIGIGYNIIVSIKSLLQVRFWKGVVKFIKYWLNILYQIWNAIKYLQFHVAVAQDLIWNATVGEAIEKLVTQERDTLYGKGMATVSAATGHQVVNNKLTNRGIKFTKLLSNYLGDNHSVEAYNQLLRVCIKNNIKLKV